VPRFVPLAVPFVLLAGCVGPSAPAGRRAPAVSHAGAPAAPELVDPMVRSPVVTPRERARGDFQARLSARGRSWIGERGPFRAQGELFGGDCSGFVQAVYAAEGILLRDLVRRAAPHERLGVAAAYAAVREHGRVLGAKERPAPGDLVFWHDTYDRNRNGKADDRFTHLGMIEHVEGGTVHFLHRGSRGVARGVMTLSRPRDAMDGARRLNTPLRSRSHPVREGGLAGALFAGYGRFDPETIPPELVVARRDPPGIAASGEPASPGSEAIDGGGGARAAPAVGVGPARRIPGS
jgi:probable lipoprotein NlpC